MATKKSIPLPTAKKLSDLADGEQAYIVGWTLTLISSGDYLAIQESPCVNFEFGTSNVLIERRGDTIRVIGQRPTRDYVRGSSEAFIEKGAATYAVEFISETPEH